MRILHLTDRLSARGGASIHLIGVIAAQAEAGHEVAVATGAAEAGGAVGVPVVLLPGLEARTRVPVALDEIWRQFPADVLHLHTIVNPHVLEWARAHPAVITVQDHRYFCPARGKWTAEGLPCAQALERGLCASCFDDEDYYEGIWSLTRERLDALQHLRVVVLSHYMHCELVAAGLDPGRVDVVPPFVHGLDLVGETSAPPCVLFAGRLTASKGLADAVQAWRQADTGLPLMVAGAGSLREWAAAQGATLLGWVAHADMAALYRRAAAVLMPSRWQEPFGIAGLEALTLRTPVVAWRSGGIPEWHPGDDSLVEWGDVEGLADALRRATGREAEVPAGFGRDPLMRRLEAVYARALA